MPNEGTSKILLTSEAERRRCCSRLSEQSSSGRCSRLLSKERRGLLRLRLPKESSRRRSTRRSE